MQLSFCKCSRVSTLNEQDQTYNLAAYLIAQLGKNYNNGANERISGKELLGLAIRQIQQIQQLQYLAGGMVIFLETADEERLLSFYRENGLCLITWDATVSSQICGRIGLPLKKAFQELMRRYGYL